MKKSKADLLTLEYDKSTNLIISLETINVVKASSGHYQKYKDIFKTYYNEESLSRLKSGNKEMSKSYFEYTDDIESLNYRKTFFEVYFKLTGRKFIDDFGGTKSIIKNILKRKKIRNEEEYRDVIDFISDNPDEAQPFLETLNELLNSYEI